MTLNDVIAILLSIFIPVITSLITVIIKRWVNSKIQDMEDKKLQSLIAEGTNIILDSVNYIQQTYVDHIKNDEGIFTLEEQSKALKDAETRALTLMPTEVARAIDTRYGSLETFVDTMIESYIAKNKQGKEL